MAASLRRHLEPVRLEGLSAPEATRLVTEQTVCWADEQGWTIEREVRGRIARTTKNGQQHARLDLVCTRPAALPAVAIEIDRSGKVWSLTKLLAEIDAGCVALWVRWRGRTKVEIPESVGLVDIHDTAYDPPEVRTPAVQMLPSPKEIEDARTPRGGFTRAQLAVWGVHWPPPKGWKQALTDRWRAAQHELPPRDT